MSENRMTKKHPHADSRLAVFLDRQIMAVKPKKQNEIAIEAGFPNANMITMLKLGTSKLPLDRVGALAKAIECDPKYLFKLALEQQGHETTAQVISEIFGAIVSDNEAIWLQALRDASGHSDPTLTNRARVALRAIFGK